jgi:hypothetical protein
MPSKRCKAPFALARGWAAGFQGMLGSISTTRQKSHVVCFPNYAGFMYSGQAGSPQPSSTVRVIFHQYPHQYQSSIFHHYLYTFSAFCCTVGIKTQKKPSLNQASAALEFAERGQGTLAKKTHLSFPDKVNASKRIFESRIIPGNAAACFATNVLHFEDPFQPPEALDEHAVASSWWKRAVEP